MTKNEQRTSRFLSLVLRHDPGAIGLSLDAEGWADVKTLLDRLKEHRKSVTRDMLENIVSENNKQRFHFSEDGTRIRAAQGHSIEIDFKLVAKTPPDVLYHGTASRFVEEIANDGILKMSRQHVHLCEDPRAAHLVGQRHGRAIILEIAAKLMTSHGHQFYLSENGVWLTEHVPPDYLNRRFKL